jgi:hypothetical protein
MDVKKDGLHGIKLYRAKLDRTLLKREQLGTRIRDEEGEYLEARDAYLSLKQNFESLGDYDAASWAYIKERKMEKKCSSLKYAHRYYGRDELGDTREKKLPVHHPKVWCFYIRHTAKWLGDWFVELLCNYGESIPRVIFWMVIAAFGFAAYYWRIGGVLLTDATKGTFTTATSFWHYLIYSFGAFTTTEFSTLQAADDHVRLITAIQAIVGIFLAGLLGFVAGNRIRRS